MSRSVRRLGSDSHRHGLSTPSRLRPAKHPYHQAGQVVGVPGIDNGEEAEERERETEVYSFPAVLQEQVGQEKNAYQPEQHGETIARYLMVENRRGAEKCQQDTCARRRRSVHPDQGGDGQHDQEILPYEVRVAGLLEVQERAAEEQTRGEGRGHPVLPAPEALRKRVTRQSTHRREHGSKDRKDLQRPDAAKVRDHGGKEVEARWIKHERLV